MTGPQETPCALTMAGEVQAPSGTGLDPSPQFCVHQAEPHGPGMLTVIGRCFFGPIRAGMVFDGIAPPRDGSKRWTDPVGCSLRIMEIYVSRKRIDFVDQNLSAQMILAGEAPASLADDALLAARGALDEGWRLDGGLWRR